MYFCFISSFSCHPPVQGHWEGFLKVGKQEKDVLQKMLQIWELICKNTPFLGISIQVIVCTIPIWGRGNLPLPPCFYSTSPPENWILHFQSAVITVTNIFGWKFEWKAAEIENVPPGGWEYQWRTQFLFSGRPRAGHISQPFPLQECTWVERRN